MEWLLVAAGIVSALSTACHLTIGYRQYLIPVNASNAGEIPKNPTLLIKFTALTYMLFTVVQLAYTVSSRSMETFKGILHWTPFLAAGILAWIGA